MGTAVADFRAALAKCHEGAAGLHGWVHFRFSLGQTAARTAPTPKTQMARGCGGPPHGFGKGPRELSKKQEQQKDSGGGRGSVALGPVLCQGAETPLEALADLPVSFAQILKIVHVAARGGVLCIQSLPLLGIGDLDEVPVVLDHELAPGELLGGYHAPALAIDEVNLLGDQERALLPNTMHGRLPRRLGLPPFLHRLY